MTEEMIAIPKEEYERLKAIEAEMISHCIEQQCALKQQIQAMEMEAIINNAITPPTNIFGL